MCRARLRSDSLRVTPSAANSSPRSCVPRNIARGRAYQPECPVAHAIAQRRRAPAPPGRRLRADACFELRRAPAALRPALAVCALTLFPRSCSKKHRACAAAPRRAGMTTVSRNVVNDDDHATRFFSTFLPSRKLGLPACAPGAKAPAPCLGPRRLAQDSAKNGTATHSTQMCVRNRTAVTCAVLAQNVSDPASSEQRLRVFKALTPADGAQEVKERHQRARLCAACDRQDVDAVLTRLMGTTGRRQLSVGVPQCLSAARPSCGAAAPRRLQRLGHLPGLRSSARPRVRRRLYAPGAFRGALLNRSHFEAAEHAVAKACPHSRAPTGEFGQCSGSVDKARWLNTSTRAQARVRAGIPKTSSSSARVNFCLLNAKTTRLCEKIVAWRREAQHIVCGASGRCPSSDFFYSPTTFDLGDQQFVYDSSRARRSVERVSASVLSASTSEASGRRFLF